MLQQPPVTQPILQPRVDTAFQPAEQSVPWPESQPAPQLRIPVAHPGIQPAPLPAPPPRMSHVIQPALQPVSQVAQSVQFGRLEPRQTEPLYSQRYQHPQPPGSSTQVLSAQSQYFSAVYQRHRLIASFIQLHLLVLPAPTLLPIHQSLSTPHGLLQAQYFL